MISSTLQAAFASLGIRCAAVSGQDSCGTRDASIAAFRRPYTMRNTSYADGSALGGLGAQQDNQEPEAEAARNVLLITSRTGSYGLDLTCANHLVLFDSWWNPQADAQAAARVDRANQTRDVTVYRLATAHEAHIVLRLHAKKLALFDWVVNGRTASAAAAAEGRPLSPSELAARQRPQIAAADKNKSKGGEEEGEGSLRSRRCANTTQVNWCITPFRLCSIRLCVTVLRLCLEFRCCSLWVVPRMLTIDIAINRLTIRKKQSSRTWALWRTLLCGFRKAFEKIISLQAIN